MVRFPFFTFFRALACLCVICMLIGLALVPKVRGQHNGEQKMFNINILRKSSFLLVLIGIVFNVGLQKFTTKKSAWSRTNLVCFRFFPVKQISANIKFKNSIILNCSMSVLINNTKCTKHYTYAKHINN